MKGRTLFIGFMVCLAAFAAGLFYTINYAYYDRLELAEFVLSTDNGDITFTNVDMIDSDRTPLKIRVCADPVDASGFAEVANATPLVAPSWFKCFDAEALSAEVASGDLKTYRVDTNTPYGFDTFLGQNAEHSYVWRQINECGEAHFSALNLPEGCPEFEE